MEDLITPPLMRKKKFLQILQNILSVDDTTFQQLLQKHPNELEDIRAIFTKASAEYNRWNTKLCFELPNELLEDYRASDDSSLILGNYYNKNKFQVRNRINLRIRIQDDLYKILSKKEKEKYGYFLKTNKNSEGVLFNTPDIGLIHFLDHIENSFNRFYLRTEKEIFEMDNNLLQLQWYQIIKLSEYSYKTVHNNILEKITNSHEQNSLAAKLLINSAINRSILEIDELSQLHCDAWEFMIRLINKIDGRIFDISNEDIMLSEIKNILLDEKLLNNEQEINKKQLIKITEKCLLDLCELHSKSMPESYEARKKNHLSLDSKFLMALTISILKYKKYKINLKGLGINHTKDYEILNKNTKIEDKFHFQIQVLINRIYNCLFYSKQYKKISIKEFARYNLAIIEKRNFLRKIFVEMKKVNLEQFSQLHKQQSK